MAMSSVSWFSQVGVRTPHPPRLQFRANFSDVSPVLLGRRRGTSSSRQRPQRQSEGISEQGPCLFGPRAHPAGSLPQPPSPPRGQRGRVAGVRLPPAFPEALSSAYGQPPGGQPTPGRSPSISSEAGPWSAWPLGVSVPPGRRGKWRKEVLPAPTPSAHLLPPRLLLPSGRGGGGTPREGHLHGKRERNGNGCVVSPQPTEEAEAAGSRHMFAGAEHLSVRTRRCPGSLQTPDPTALPPPRTERGRRSPRCGDCGREGHTLTRRPPAPRQRLTRQDGG